MFGLLVAISNSGLPVGPNYYTGAGWPFGSRTFFTKGTCNSIQQLF